MIDIEKLLISREKIEEYKRINKIKGCKAQVDSDILHNTLLSIGFDNVSSFYDFNFGMNLKEADKCFRFRSIDNNSIPALCDSCTGRFKVPCFAPGLSQQEGICEQSGIDLVYAFDKYYPELNWVHEQEQESVKTGFVPAFFPRAFCFFMMDGVVIGPEKYCTGIAVKILEPEFNIMWGMDKYASVFGLGQKIYDRAMRMKEE